MFHQFKAFSSSSNHVGRQVFGPPNFELGVVDPAPSENPPSSSTKKENLQFVKLNPNEIDMVCSSKERNPFKPFRVLRTYTVEILKLLEGMSDHVLTWICLQRTRIVEFLTQFDRETRRKF